MRFNLFERPSWKIPETLEEVKKLMNEVDERIYILMEVREHAWDPYGFLRRDIEPLIQQWLVYRKLLIDAYLKLKERNSNGN